MPSFDIVSRVDVQTLDNAVNVAIKEIGNRYDFKGSQVTVELDKKTFLITIAAETEMKLKQAEDVLLTKAMRQGLEARHFDFSAEPSASGKQITRKTTVKNGIDKDTAKKIVKVIKDSKLKVQAAIMDDTIRVTAKKIDDLQAAIQLCRTEITELPLQFVNMKS